MHAIDVDVLVALLDLLSGDRLSLNAERARHGGLTVDLFQAFFGQCDSDRATAFEPGSDARLGLKLPIKLLRILRELGHVLRRAQLRDQASSVPGGTASKLLAF